jgi:hypothetical protein
MAFTESDYRLIQQAAKKAGADTSGWKMKKARGGLGGLWDDTGGSLIKGIKDTVTAGARAQERAANKALKKQEEAAAAAQTNLNEQAEIGRGLLDEGSAQAAGQLGGTSNRLVDLLDSPGSFQADPGYQFRLQQGENAIMRSAAARGGRMGGDTLKALMEHGQGLASQEYQNAFQRAGMADQSDFSKRSALANLYSQTASGKANMGIGAAAQGANLSGQMMSAYGAMPQYAGGADQGWSNFLMGAAGTAAGGLGGLGMSYLSQAMQPQQPGTKPPGAT